MTEEEIKKRRKEINDHFLEVKNEILNFDAGYYLLQCESSKFINEQSTTALRPDEGLELAVMSGIKSVTVLTNFSHPLHFKSLYETSYFRGK